MKKFKIWSMMMLVVMAIPLMVACGGDDDDDAIQLTKENLVGHWKCISGQLLEDNQILEGDNCPSLAIIFYDDGICQWWTNGDHPHWIYGSYRLAGKNLAIDFKSHRQQNILDYGNVDYEIVTFSKNMMVLKWGTYISYTMRKE